MVSVYKLDAIEYGTYNVGTCSFHLFVFFLLLFFINIFVYAFIIYFIYLFMHFCPGTMTTHARSIHSDLQRLRHTQHWTHNTELCVVSIVDSIVTNSVPISLENTKTTRTRLRL